MLQLQKFTGHNKVIVGHLSAYADVKSILLLIVTCTYSSIGTLLTCAIRKRGMNETCKVHPVEARLFAAAVRVKGRRGELKAMIAQDRTIDDVIVSEADKGSPGGWEKHLTSWGKLSNQIETTFT